MNFEHYSINKHADDFRWNESYLKSICGRSDVEYTTWIADMDYPLPDFILEKAYSYLKTRTFRYTKNDVLEETYRKYLKDKFNLEDTFLMSTSGVLKSIYLILQNAKLATNTVIIPSPTYRMFTNVCESLDMNIIYWPLKYENLHYTLDFKKLEDIYASNHKATLLFCSPHNPSGRVFSKEELIKVAKMVKKYEGFIVSDEIHGDMALYDNKHIPFDIIAKEYDLDSYTITSPCKAFNIPSEHVSFVISHKQKLIDQYNKWCVDTFSGRASLASAILANYCYANHKDYLKALKEHLEKQIELYKDLPLVKPEASFIAFLDLSAYTDIIEKDVMEHPEYYKNCKHSLGGKASFFFGRKANICVHDGSWFGDSYKNFVRVNYASNTKDNTGVVKRIKSALEIN